MIESYSCIVSSLHDFSYQETTLNNIHNASAEKYMSNTDVQTAIQSIFTKEAAPVNSLLHRRTQPENLKVVAPETSFDGISKL